MAIMKSNFHVFVLIDLKGHINPHIPLLSPLEIPSLHVLFPSAFPFDSASRGQIPITTIHANMSYSLNSWKGVQKIGDYIGDFCRGYFRPSGRGRQRRRQALGTCGLSRRKFGAQKDPAMLMMPAAYPIRTL